MIAKSRRMAAHDFLLVLLSAAVLALLLWQPGPTVREVQVRRNDGSLQTYQLAADDPKLANLIVKLQQWSAPTPNSQTAINKWNAELGSLYAARSIPKAMEELKQILPVSYYPDHAKKRQAAAQHAALLKKQQAYWLNFQQKAERAVQAEQQRQKHLLSLHKSPPISVGEVQAGPYQRQALLFSPLIGLGAALLFSVWNFLTPSIQLVRHASLSGQSQPPAKQGSGQAQTRPPSSNANADSLQFQVTLPAKWLKIRQPIGVYVRQMAYFSLIGLVVLLSFASVLPQGSQWRGFPARMLWGGHQPDAVFPSKPRSTSPIKKIQKLSSAPRPS